MKSCWPHCLALLLMLATGCATQGDQAWRHWRDFQAQVDALDESDRQAQLERLLRIEEHTSSAMSRLQLAYLTLRDPLPMTAAVSAETAQLLDSVDDSDTLASVRDMLRQVLSFRDRYRHEMQQRSSLALKCQEYAEHNQALQGARDALQSAVATCNQQLDALKKIESLMSNPVNTLEPES